VATHSEYVADLADVRLAQKKMVNGERVGEVTYQGRKVTFVDVSLPQLAEEEKRLSILVARPTRKRYSMISTGKGF